MLGVVFFLFGLVLGGVFFSLGWWEVFSLLMIGVFIVLPLGYSQLLGFWGISYGLSVDLLGWSLVILSIWVGGLMMMSSVRLESERGFISMVLLLVLFLVVTFMVMDYLWFYVFFESSLIPILLIILGWGYQPERLQAGLYMLFYTLFGSLPLLISFLYLDSFCGSLGYDVVWWYVGGGVLWYFFSILAFLIKMPMFLVHLWLPKAHVEAPVAGSMILAGVLLKLGGYGMLRLVWFFMGSGVSLGLVFVSISLIGALIVGFMCLRQSDLKALIAYSSVSHMGLVLGGVFSMNGWGWQGALVLMLGHGLCSSGLFCLANMVYERLGSRSLLVGSGLMGVFPGMCLWWFLLGICNMAAPPSLNLMGEIMLFISLVGWSKIFIISLVGVSFISAVYTLYMYSITQHGSLALYFGFSDCSLREYLVLFLHWAPLNLFILSGDSFYFWN